MFNNTGNSFGGMGGMGMPSFNTQDRLIAPDQNITQGLFQTGDQAILYVFMPAHARALSDQAQRPLGYSINDEFVNKAAEVVSNAAYNPGSSVSSIDNLFKDNSAMFTMRPASSPTAMIKMNQLSHNWRFVFVMTRDKNSAGGMISSIHPMTKIREIYYGFFTEEPLNPTTMMSGRPVANPNALMTFTHKTCVEIMPSQGAAGLASKLYTRADDQVFNPNLLRAISTNPEQQYYIDPAHLAANLATNDTNDTFSTPGLTNKVRDNGAASTLFSAMEQPHQNVKHIVKATFLGHEEQITKSRSALLHPGASGMFNNNPGFGSGGLIESVQAHLMKAPSVFGGGKNSIDVNDVWSLGRLVQQFHAQIKPFREQGGLNYGFVDQSEMNPRNVFSSLLCSTVPSLLAMHGLSRLVFSVDTDHGMMVTDPYQNTRYIAFDSLYPITDETKAIQAQAVVNNLKSGIFAMMIAEQGDFNLYAQFSTGGISQVILNFKSNSMDTDAIYESPSIYGGLQSPMIGDTVASMNNSQQISMLVNALAGDSVFDTNPLGRGSGMGNNQPIVGPMDPSLTQGLLPPGSSMPMNNGQPMPNYGGMGAPMGGTTGMMNNQPAQMPNFGSLTNPNSGR